LASIGKTDRQRRFARLALVFCTHLRCIFQVPINGWLIYCSIACGYAVVCQKIST